MRYVLEGEWTGYRSSQRKVVHRVVIGNRQRAEKHAGTYIVFDDGTGLELSVRPAWAWERVQEIHGYTSLIHDAERAGKLGQRVTVRELMAIDAMRRIQADAATEGRP